MDLNKRKNYCNRHIDGLPEDKTIIRVLVDDPDEVEYLCIWNAFNPDDYKEGQMPDKGYLGTARTIALDHNIGFNVWEHNDYEFIYYSIV